MVTPPTVNIITVASVATGVAPTALAAAIVTLQAVDAASRERTMCVVVATGTS
jgi:hypothetical protein